MPRKKPAPEDYRTYYLHVRVSEKEKARIAYRASLRCMGISEYLRQLGIHGSLPSLEDRQQAELALKEQKTKSTEE